MKKGIKRVLIVIVSALALLAIVITGVAIQVPRTIKAIQSEYANLSPVDLNTIHDGIYKGKFGSVPDYVNLRVTVKEHRITNIAIKQQLSGKGYDAKETVQRIIDTQQPKVDVVTGATMSSKCIMIATSKALLPNRK